MSPYLVHTKIRLKADVINGQHSTGTPEQIFNLSKLAPIVGRTKLTHVNWEVERQVHQIPQHSTISNSNMTLAAVYFCLYITPCPLYIPHQR